MIVSRSVLLSLKTLSEKKTVENQNISFMYNNFFPKIILPPIVWNNTVEPDSPQMAAKYGARNLHAGYATLKAHTQNM